MHYTIYDIKKLTSQTNPCFFSRENMKGFNQTLKDFKLKHLPDDRVLISAVGSLYMAAPLGIHGKINGITRRIFNPANNELEFLTNNEKEMYIK